MSGVVFSESARLDRRAIPAHTVERFGIAQARRFRERFEKILASLARSPALGQTRKELDPPGHTFRYYVVLKTFIIVYEPIDGGIRVARLLHGARHVGAELEHDAGGS